MNCSPASQGSSPLQIWGEQRWSPGAGSHLLWFKSSKNKTAAAALATHSPINTHSHTLYYTHFCIPASPNTVHVRETGSTNTSKCFIERETFCQCTTSWPARQTWKRNFVTPWRVISLDYSDDQCLIIPLGVIPFARLPKR